MSFLNNKSFRRFLLFAAAAVMLSATYGSYPASSAYFWYESLLNIVKLGTASVLLFAGVKQYQRHFLSDHDQALITGEASFVVVGITTVLWCILVMVVGLFRS